MDRLHLQHTFPTGQIQHMPGAGKYGVMRCILGLGGFGLPNGTQVRWPRLTMLQSQDKKAAQDEFCPPANGYIPRRLVIGGS